MKALYKTCFFLGKNGGQAPKLEDAAKLCVDWVFAPGANPRAGLTEKVRPVGPLPIFPLKELGGSWAYEAKLFASGARRAWGLRLINRDNEDTSIQWVTEIVFDAQSLSANPQPHAFRAQVGTSVPAGLRE